jgi:hypothetical protein
MPCHPMGWLVICGLVVVGLGAVNLCQSLLELASISGADAWPFLLIFPTVVAGWVIAERHS